MKMKITIVSGSPRKESVTVRVAKHLLETFKEKYPQYEFQLVSLQDYQIPFVEKVWSTINDVPLEFKPAAEKIYNADAFVLVTPEYNGSMSSALRNLFDHFPKQNKKKRSTHISKQKATNTNHALTLFSKISIATSRR